VSFRLHSVISSQLLPMHMLCINSLSSYYLVNKHFILITIAFTVFFRISKRNICILQALRKFFCFCPV